MASLNIILLHIISASGGHPDLQCFSFEINLPFVPGGGGLDISCSSKDAILVCHLRRRMTLEGLCKGQSECSSICFHLGSFTLTRHGIELYPL